MRRLFDEKKLEWLILEPEDVSDSMESIFDFIDSEIRRNVRAALEKVNQEEHLGNAFSLQFQDGFIYKETIIRNTINKILKSLGNCTCIPGMARVDCPICRGVKP